MLLQYSQKARNTAQSFYGALRGAFLSGSHLLAMLAWVSDVSFLLLVVILPVVILQGHMSRQNSFFLHSV